MEPQVRELILNTRIPLILRKTDIQWKCFSQGLETWCHNYDADEEAEELSFERMPMRNGTMPQWERRREKVKQTMADFIVEQNTKQSHWTALNYKREFEIPAACRQGIDFSCFGFPHATEDLSFWLGSRGANTPCHYDTYGCNIVVQIYGEKSWLLFPPDTATLTSTRIPYEESSVYCLENFYSPNPKELSNFEKLNGRSYRCLLKPGEVLIVPRHWWHYVEAYSTSLSINYWIPLECDAEAQLEECLTKYIIEQLVRRDDVGELEYLLNPNQLSQLSTEPELLLVLQHLSDLQTHVDSMKVSKKKSPHPYPYQYKSEDFVNELLLTMPNVEKLKPTSDSVLTELLKTNATRFDPESKSETDKSLIKEILINSICNPSVIREIKRNFLERYRLMK